MMHELYFDDRPAVEKALKSVVGQKAGQTLHWITGGHVSLFLADHHEDDIENLHRTQGKSDPEAAKNETSK